MRREAAAAASVAPTRSVHAAVAHSATPSVIARIRLADPDGIRLADPGRIRFAVPMRIR